jgi:hypothetical protein
MPFKSLAMQTLKVLVSKCIEVFSTLFKQTEEEEMENNKSVCLPMVCI